MSEHDEQALISRASMLSGVAVGLLHAGIAVILWNHWFDDLGQLAAVKPLNALYLGGGMFLLGFVPAMFYVGRKVVSPAIIVGALLILSGVGTWLAGTVRAPSATPTPFGLYILFWVGIVALAGVSARWETRRRQRSIE